MTGLVRRSTIVAGLTSACLFLYVPAAHALQEAFVLFSATGSIVFQEPCSETEVCQVAVISGKATQFGAFTGVLNERVDLQTGHYTGTGTFTFTSGATIDTAYVGQVAAPTTSGPVIFAEERQIIGWERAVGQRHGPSHRGWFGECNGKLSIIGVGALSW